MDICPPVAILPGQQSTYTPVRKTETTSACVIFNLHVDHRPDEIEKARTAFVRLIDHAIAQSGSYYLTYHRWAEPRQLQTCYPELSEWLRYKRAIDPGGLFASDWFSYLVRTAEGGSQ
jgi:hypothetical protein